MLSIFKGQSLTYDTSPVGGREADQQQLRRPHSVDAGVIGKEQLRRQRQQRQLDAGSMGLAEETNEHDDCSFQHSL